jgi:hypothetical protein
MAREEKDFRLRFSLEALFPEGYEGDADEYAWLQEWEKRMKPEIIKLVFESLRRHPGWQTHIRSRGLSPVDEIEIALVRDFSPFLHP